MRIHRNYLFGMAAVVVTSLALGSGCVVEDDSGNLADHPEGGSNIANHPEGGSTSSTSGGSAGTSVNGGEGGAAARGVGVDLFVGFEHTHFHDLLDRFIRGARFGSEQGGEQALM